MGQVLLICSELVLFARKHRIYVLKMTKTPEFISNRKEKLKFCAVQHTLCNKKCEVCSTK